MIIRNKLNGRYYIYERNATAGELIFTLIRALDMVVKEVAKRKHMDQEVLMENVISILRASAKCDHLLPETVMFEK